MGQSESSFKRTYSETVSQLSNVQLGEISSRFNELYAKAGGAKGLVVDREAFSKYLNLPVAIGDRLFDAFDEKKNGSICFEEFVCGLAIVLHGSFRERCGLLFRVFNIGNDEGISRAELRTMLTAILQSTNTILYTVGESDRAVLGGEDMQQTITNMVDTAFANCDISRTGKLLPLEFEYWLKRNPKILDSLLAFKTKKEECTLGSLIMSPSEQKLGASPSLSDRRSSLPDRRGSRERGRDSQVSTVSAGSSFAFQAGFEADSLAEAGTGHMFQVGSESASQISDGDRQGSLTPSDLPPAGRRMFSVGSETDSLLSISSSRQGSLTSDRPQPVATVTQDLPTQHSGLGVVLESGQDTPQSTSGQDITSGQDAGQTSGHAQPSETLIQIDGDTATEEPASSQVSLQMDSERDLSISVAVEGLEEEEQEVGMVQGGVAVSSEQVDGEATPHIGLDLDEQSKDRDVTLASSEQASSDFLDPPDSTAGGGSIMLADSNLSINIAAIPRVDSLGPASPVLPTRQAEEKVLPELPEGGGEEEEMRIEVATEAMGDMGVALEDVGVALALDDVGVTLVEGMMEDPAFEPHDATPISSATLQQPLTVPAPRSGNVSPCMDELEGSEVKDSISQAWVLSKWTRGLLENPQPGTHLTCPALMTDIKLVDGIHNYLVDHFPDRPRKALLSVEQISMDAAGLRRLVSSGSLHSALELTGRFLSAHGQGLGQAGQPTIHTHKTLQMWSARIALLMYLRLYKEAELEMQAFGEMLNPDLYYQYHTHSYPGKKGSLVPFTLRLLHANLPRHTSKVQLCLDRLCTLQYVCEQIITDLGRGRLPDATEPLSKSDQEVAECLWKDRLCKVRCYLANTLVSVQDYGAAVKLYEQIIEDQSIVIRAEVLSGIGRLYLQLGDMKTATSYFDRVETEVQHLIPQSPLVKLNEGYVNVFLSRWQTACDCFEEAMTLDPASKVIQSNITVCNFYMGRLKESIGAMEKLLTSDPPASLQPALFANLATTYELESGNSSVKKLSFIPLLAEHIGQGYQHLSMLNIR